MNFDKFEDYEDDLFFDKEYQPRFMSKEHKKALRKNEILIENLNESRTNFLGIGTNKIKRRLNKISTTDDIALAIRLALETEDKNITAKNLYGSYREKTYNLKNDLILKLIQLFLKNPTWIFGIEKKEGIETNTIIYFEIPDMEQISWHNNFKKEDFKNLPDYGKPWDGKVNSTLNKIAKTIKTKYTELIY